MTNIYKLALQVQDASNPSGVINSLANEVMPAIRDEPGYREQGTSYVTQHPVLLLFLDKLVSLTRKGWIHDEDMAIADAYTRVHEMVDAEERAIDDHEDTVHNAAGSNVPLPAAEVARLAERRERGDFSTEKFEVG